MDGHFPHRLSARAGLAELQPPFCEASTLRTDLVGGKGDHHKTVRHCASGCSSSVCDAERAAGMASLWWNADYSFYVTG